MKTHRTNVEAAAIQLGNVPTIIYGHDRAGNFIAVDTAAKVCAYAYRTSQHADDAKKNPYAVAAEMLHNERELFKTMPAPDYYWQRYQDSLAMVSKGGR